MKSYLLAASMLLSNLSYAQAPVTGEGMLAAVNAQITNITAEQLQQQIVDQPETVIIDVRTQFEVNLLGTLGVYQNINIPRGWIEFDIAEAVPDLNTPIVVYCGTNVRSPMAAKTLMDMGYTNVTNYAGGYFEWQEMGLDVNMGTLDPATFLYQRPEKVVEGVYTAIGAPAPSTYQNSGHNNNLSFIVADDAVVVFNGGGSYLLAKAMHEEIKLVTDLPVKHVIYENAQGHAVFGGSYWKQQGAEIIAHENTVEILHETEEKMVERAKRSLRDKYTGSYVVYPERTFTDEYVVPVKGKEIVLKHFGHAHSPDDMQLWLPEDELLISGDFAFNVRMLPVLEHTDMLAWQENWPQLEALNPKIIIPGHGGVTDLETVTYYTMGYVNYMVDEVMAVLDDGGTLTDAYKIDQSQFMQWKTYRELSLRNAAELYKIAEFEW